MKKSVLKPYITRLPQPALRVLAAVGLWLGSGMVIICGLFWILGAYWALTNDPRLVRLNPNPQLSIVEFFARFWLGIGVLLVSFPLLEWSEWVTPSEKSVGTRIRETTDGYVRALIHPASDDHLNQWKIYFDIDSEELAKHLDEMTKRPMIPIVDWLKSEGTLPISSVRKKRVAISSSAATHRVSQWYGLLSRNESGKAILVGQVDYRDRLTTWIHFVVDLVWNIVIPLLAFVGIAALLKGQWRVLFVVGVLHMFKVGIGRLRRHGLRQHERQLEPFFRDQLGATKIELKTRYEIFSIGWWKNFRQNR